MSFGTSYSITAQLQPFSNDKLWRTIPVLMPYGGDVNGVPFVAGVALSVVSTTAVNEVRTLTLGSTPSGTVTVILYFATGPVIFSFAYNASIATVQAALNAAIPGWAGLCIVSGTAGSSYVFTFSGAPLSQVSIGGKWTATITSGTATWARTTQGSSGQQYDVYSQANNNNPVDAFLSDPCVTDPTGAQQFSSSLVNAVGQPQVQFAYQVGTFAASAIVGLDTNAYTVSPRLVKVGGGTQVQLV